MKQSELIKNSDKQSESVEIRMLKYMRYKNHLKGKKRKREWN